MLGFLLLSFNLIFLSPRSCEPSLLCSFLCLVFVSLC